MLSLQSFLQKAVSERKHGLSTEQFPVSVYMYAGSSKNLKDLEVSLQGGQRVWGEGELVEDVALLHGLRQCPNLCRPARCVQGGLM